jgi:D-sedoheptulose 7-phosphate isomerase
MEKLSIDTYLEECGKVVRLVRAEELIALVDELYSAAGRGQSVYVIGNGACAALADHLAADFAKADVPDQYQMRIESLVSNSSLLTAIGNDISFDDVFASQLKNRVVAGDLVLALTASGRSKNVVRALDVAHAAGARTAIITGFMEPFPQALNYSDIAVRVRSAEIDQIENVQVAVHHALLRAYVGRYAA